MAPKRRRQVLGDPKSFRGEFSFVNKDASNIDSKDHNAAVSWHVMNRYERWKRKEEAKKLRASAHLPTTHSASASSAVAPEDDPGFEAYPPSPWQMETLEQCVLGSAEQPSSYNCTQLSSFAEGPINPIFVPQGLPSNPPDTLQTLAQPQDPAQYPPIVAQILSYAYGHVVPITWPNEFGKAKWTYEISRTWDEIVAIREDSCYASALLCFYATLMAAATNDRDITSQACFFQVQAMTELRQRMENQPNGHDSLTLKAILKLFSAETALDNTSAARVHMKSLRNFVNSAGGVFTLDPWFRENLLATDCYFALKYETRPLFPASEWTPGSINQPWKARLAQAHIHDDHAAGIDASIDHVNLRSIIGDLRELFRVEQYINTHDVAADDQFLRWRQLRKLDCLNRLAEHQLSVKIYPHLYERPKLQLAVCAATALMAAMVLGSPEPVRSGLKLLTELRIKVGEARAEVVEGKDHAGRRLQSGFEDILLWILSVGALGERTHPVSTYSLWFQNELNTMMIGLALPGLEAQRQVLRNFLHSPTLEHEVHSGRAHRTGESRKGVYELCGMSWRTPFQRVPEVEVSGAEGPVDRKGKQNEW